MREYARDIYRGLRDWLQGTAQHERSRELMGAILARQVASIDQPESLAQVEFRVYSQFGDDGIIQWLISHLDSLPKRFVEFGVEDYTEANTRFLMVNNGWRGLVMDGSKSNIERLRRRPWFWRCDLEARACFLTRENVEEQILSWANGHDIGILHIDVDGNDYWLWEALNRVQPSVVIMEYNAIFGAERAITVPYRADFARLSAHHSGQYYGASLEALTHLASAKGYALVGTNSAGNNAYFVSRALLNDQVREIPVVDAYTPPIFRESRDARGNLDYRDLAARHASTSGLPVVNVKTGETEIF